MKVQKEFSGWLKLKLELEKQFIYMRFVDK